MNQFEKVVEKPNTGGQDQVNTQAWLHQGAEVLNPESHPSPGWAAVSSRSTASTSGPGARAWSVPPSPDHPQVWAQHLAPGRARPHTL